MTPFERETKSGEKENTELFKLNSYLEVKIACACFPCMCVRPLNSYCLTQVTTVHYFKPEVFFREKGKSNLNSI